MRSLETPLRKGKQLRVIGFDDAPFDKLLKKKVAKTSEGDRAVNLAGIVCSNTRFEGMLWDSVTHDGMDATEVIARMVAASKFHAQLNMVLTDGITVAGFNMIDIAALSETLQVPCVAVMRKLPDLESFFDAMDNVDNKQQRVDIVKKAGEIFSLGRFHFQVAGCPPEMAAEALERVTDNGDVPEALRLAHFIGAAVETGESSNRA